MNVIDQVFAEVERATQKYPTWPTDPLHALAVLGEEFGELTKAMLQLTYEPHKTSHADVHEEAVQTAAMALRLAMSLKRYGYAPSHQHCQSLDAGGQREYPTFQHPDDSAVDRFAAAMKAKMAASRAKGRSGWDNEALCSSERLQAMLADHLTKGDPVDVGNFAMMLFNRGDRTTAVGAGDHADRKAQVQEFETAIKDFVAGYEVDTGEGIYQPNEHERFLIDMAIRDALHDDDLGPAFAAITEASSL